MKAERIASWYAILVGISMPAMWSMFFLTDGIPELITNPAEIGMHIAAELLTAASLVFAGAGILLRRSWGVNLYFVAMGMLLYTLIASPGYYIQRSNFAFVMMFAALFVISVVLMVAMAAAHSAAKET
jgi:hypothetical protein